MHPFPLADGTARVVCRTPGIRSSRARTEKRQRAISQLAAMWLTPFRTVAGRGARPEFDIEFVMSDRVTA